MAIICTEFSAVYSKYIELLHTKNYVTIFIANIVHWNISYQFLNLCRFNFNFSIWSYSIISLWNPLTKCNCYFYWVWLLPKFLRKLEHMAQKGNFSTISLIFFSSRVKNLSEYIDTKRNDHFWLTKQNEMVTVIAKICIKSFKIAPLFCHIVLQYAFISSNIRYCCYYLQY